MYNFDGLFTHVTEPARDASSRPTVGPTGRPDRNGGEVLVVAVATLAILIAECVAAIR